MLLSTLLKEAHPMAAHLFRRYSEKIPFWLMRHIVNLWPPFFGAGIRVAEVHQDFKYLKVELRRSWFNTNYVGTQFGGSIYAMVDPFYMLMLMNILGKDYIVWDKAAKIHFLKPGRSRLTAEFTLSPDIIESVRGHTEKGDKYVFDLPVDINDEQGVIIAHVTKTMYVRKKRIPST
jgi:acyl-coenzyme A thioesterase PaaI-like protein